MNYLINHMEPNVVSGSQSVNTLEEWPKLGDRKTVKDNRDRTSENVPDLTSRFQTQSSSNDNINVESEVVLLNGSKASNPSNKVCKPSSKTPNNTSALRTSKRKKVKKSTPLQVDICSVIQYCLLKKTNKQTRDVLPLKKRNTLKKKVIVGNQLDSDQPKRHKGKVRPWKLRELSNTKKLICASRKVQLQRMKYNRDVLRFKERLGSSLKRGVVDIDSLVDNFTSVSLVEDVQGVVPSEPDINKMAKDIIHTKKFRPYCDNFVTEQLKSHTKTLILMLRKFQDRMHAKDEIKAHAKKRYVCGFNEAKKYLLVDRVKLLIVATNLEMEQGLPSMNVLQSITDVAKEKNVPVIYGGRREELGYWSLKKKIGIFAVMNYDGANQAHSDLIEAWSLAKSEYSELQDRIIQLTTKKLNSSSTSICVIKKEVEDEIKDTILMKLKG